MYSYWDHVSSFVHWFIDSLPRFLFSPRPRAFALNIPRVSRFILTCRPSGAKYTNATFSFFSSVLSAFLHRSYYVSRITFHVDDAYR